MGALSVFLTAFALSMDAFAVSVTKGMTLKKINLKIASKIALFFGLFQGIMPLLGWTLGIRFESYIKSVDHWIALLLLGYIGIKMILDARGDDSIDLGPSTLNNGELLVLSVATSIDALAVGISFAFLNINIFPICTTIGIVTFITCLIGVLVGKQLGSLFKNYAQIIGGIILILIGLNIFNEHTHFISLIFL